MKKTVGKPFQHRSLAGAKFSLFFLLLLLSFSGFSREVKDTIVPTTITGRLTYTGNTDNAWFIVDLQSPLSTRKVSGATILMSAVKYADTTQMLAAYLSAINNHTATLASHLSTINQNTAAIALINVQLPKKVDSIKVIGSTLYYYANGGIQYPAGTVSGGSGGTVTWSNVTGTPTTAAGYNLTDVYTKSQLATVATTGSYNDLSNKPTIPASQVNSDWNSASGVSQILNKPALDSTGITALHSQGYYDNRYGSAATQAANSASITTLNGYFSSGQLKGTSFPAQSGDVSNSAGSLVTTVVGVRGASIPALATGNLRYNGSSFFFDGTNYAPLNSPVFTGTPQWSTDTLATKAYARSVGGTGGAGMANPMTTQYDLIYGGTGGTPARLGAGTNGQYLGVRSGIVGYYGIQASDVPTLNQNTTGTASNIVGVLGASSFPAITGDVNNIQGSLSTTVVGLKGVSLPSLATGNLKYNGAAFVFDNTTYQTQLNGTGFVKATGSTITYDNSTYVPTSTSVNGKGLSTNVTLSLASSDFANQGTTSTVLHGNAAGAPSFGAVSLTGDVTGILSVSNGGNGVSNPALIPGSNISLSGSWPNYTISATGFANPMTTSGDLIYGGASGVATRLATGTGFLKGGSVPSYSAVNLASSDVTGVLGTSNGGAGSMAANTIKGNNTGSTANGADLTATQVTAMLNTFGTTTKGVVPAPSAVNNFFLRDDGTWASVGTGSLPPPLGHIGQYITTTDGSTYSWGGVAAPNTPLYTVNGYGNFFAANTDSIGVEGATNKWWTNSRTLSSTLTGWATNTTAITSASTVIGALESLAGNQKLKLDSVTLVGSNLYYYNNGGTQTLIGTVSGSGSSYANGSANTNVLAWNGSTYAPRNLASGDIPDLSSTYITVAASQNITGVKTFSPTLSSASGTDYGAKFLINQAQSGTAGITGIYESLYPGSVGSGNKYLMDLGTDNSTFTAHTSKVAIDSFGTATFQGSVYANGGFNTSSSFPTFSNLLIPSGNGFGNASTSPYQFAGATNVHYQVAFAGGGAPSLTAGYSWTDVLFPTISINTASSGTHALLSRMVINPPSISSGGSAVTNTASLYVNGAASFGISGGKNYTAWFSGGVTALTGGEELGRTTVSDAAYTVQKTDRVVAYTALTATRAVTLPAASTVKNQWFTIVDEAGTAGTNNITVVGTINGTANPTIINTNNGGYTFYSNGTSFVHPTSN